MSDVDRLGDLTLHHDPQFQKREWAVQRAGWIGMLLVILAAAAGLFGPGPLSSARAGESGAAVQLEYQRFWRYLSPTRLQVRLAPAETRDGKAAIWLSQAYLDGFEVQTVTPRPSRVVAASDRQIFEFDFAPGDRPSTVTFNLLPDAIGLRSGQLGLEGEQPLSFSQMIYP